MNLLRQAKQISETGLCKDKIEKITFNQFGIRQLKILHNILLGKNAALALSALYNARFFDFFIPEIRKNVELKSEKPFKKIWPHTLQVITNTPKILTLRWAALFHDLGKAESFELKNGKVTFYNHEEISANIFKSFAYKYPIFTQDQIKEIYTIILYHGYLEFYNYKWSDTAVKRLCKKVEPYLDNLLIFIRADLTTQNSEKKKKILEKRDQLEKRIANVFNREIKNPLLPKGIGTQISVVFDIPVGKKIGIIKQYLENMIEQNKLEANKDINYYIEFLKLDSFLRDSI